MNTCTRCKCKTDQWFDFTSWAAGRKGAIHVPLCEDCAEILGNQIESMLIRAWDRVSPGQKSVREPRTVATR